MLLKHFFAFIIKIAYDYLELSNVIYSVEDESYDLPGDYRMLLFDEFVTNDRAMVVVSESKQIVAAVFCGTDNVNDWVCMELFRF